MFSSKRQLRPARNPYAANCSYSSAQASGGMATKVYKIDVPVYAGPDLPLGTDAKSLSDANKLKDDWKSIKHRFSVQNNKETRTYEVLHNMANSVVDEFKVYPPTGLEDKDGNSYFPYNTWGYAISGRNLKQYNSPMLLDSLVWNNYVVRGVGIDFTAVGGANQTGQFECCLIPNGVSLPPEPMTNMPNSFKVALANGGGKFVFDVAPGNTGQKAKDLRGVQERFDSNSDFGIIYFRCTSVGGYEQPVVIGNARISVVVDLLNNNPNPFSQLIGAWMEAGYPIRPDDSVNPDDGPSVGGGSGNMTLSTHMISKTPKGKTVDLKQVARGKAHMPRWYLTPKASDRFVEPLSGAHAAVLEHFKLCQHRVPMGRTNEVTAKVDFPAAVSGYANCTLKGDMIMRKALEAKEDGEQTIYEVTTPKYPLVDLDTGYVKGDKVKLNIIPAKSNPSMKFTYQSEAMANPRFIADGGVKASFNVTDETGGLKVGVTFKDITSFSVGASQEEFDKGNYHQVGIGYSDSEGVEPLDTGSNGWMAGLAKAIAAAGTVFATHVSDGKEVSAGALKSNLSNAFGRGSGTRSPGVRVSSGKHRVARPVASGVGDSVIGLQAVGLVVPDNATYRSKIGKITDTLDELDYDFLQGFLKAMPSASQYGLVDFDPEKLDEKMARLTITGQAVNVTQGLLGLVGVLPKDFNPTFSADVKSVTLLAASRVDPVADPEKFLETCISITPIGDSFSTGHTEGAMYRKPQEGKLDFQVRQCTVQGNKIREENASLSAFYFAPVACDILSNFTVAWPDQLIDPDTMSLKYLEAGETVYFSILKGSARTFATVCPSGTGLDEGLTYDFLVFPDLTDKADLPLFKIDLDGMTVVGTTMLSGADDKFVDQPKFAVDTERKFTLENSTPLGEDEVQGKKGDRRLMRTV